jgi:hypothetical protein
MVLDTINGKQVFRGMETKDEAFLIFIDPNTGLKHTLKSFGSLHIDHRKMVAKLQSPLNVNGSVDKDLQVFFEDDKGEIHADKVFIKYEEVGKKIIPARIVLEGNLRIENHFENFADAKKENQYILAHRVDFIPQTSEMIFKAEKGKRVLLYDKGNNLQVSAPRLKIIRDKSVKKETLQGIGDIRFNFIENELDQFRRQFSFEKKMPGKGNEMRSVEKR